MPAAFLEALTTVLALIAFGLLCGAYLCPHHIDDNYREWTVRRKRRKDARSAANAGNADASQPAQRG